MLDKNILTNVNLIKENWNNLETLSVMNNPINCTYISELKKWITRVIADCDMETSMSLVTPTIAVTDVTLERVRSTGVTLELTSTATAVTDVTLKIPSSTITLELSTNAFGDISLDAPSSTDTSVISKLLSTTVKKVTLGVGTITDANITLELPKNNVDTKSVQIWVIATSVSSAIFSLCVLTCILIWVGLKCCYKNRNIISNRNYQGPPSALQLRRLERRVRRTDESTV
jgi:hypothetical protein